MKKGGIFITFEGGDGVGKTTLIDQLYLDLQKGNCPVFKTRAPGGTEVGQEIRKLVLHTEKSTLDKRCELLLFLADRAQHVETVILPELAKGTCVLCDRFNDSTVAYQGGARGFSSELVKNLCTFACQDLKPHLTFYLDLDPVVGFQRAKKAGFKKDRIESEDIAFHQKIREAFLEIAKEDPQRFCVLDASKPVQEVFLLAKEKIDALIKPFRK
jgi:dTMP kinase